MAELAACSQRLAHSCCGWFPGAAVKKCLKRGDKRGHVLVLSQLWEPEVGNQSVSRLAPCEAEA